MKVRSERSHGDRVARLVLAAPKANVLDGEMMEELTAACGELAGAEGLCAVVLSGEGPHFSFGASVEEHLPERIGEALDRLHRLLEAVLDLPAPTLAAIRGQCLGGGLELALACDLLLVEESARLGCPEIRLGVFPPAAAALLPVRIGAGPAAELVLTGASWTGARAVTLGLAARTAPEGELETALDAWLTADFLPRSSQALRQACRAARRLLRRALDNELPFLERQYLEELMAEPDAEEGIRAFLEKREPRWAHGGA